MFLSAVNPNLDFRTFSQLSTHTPILNPIPSSHQCLNLLFSSRVSRNYFVKPLACFSNSKESDSKSETNRDPSLNSKPKVRRTRRQKTEVIKNEDENAERTIPTTKQKKKPRHGRKSEAAAVEDFIRDSLDRTFAAIRQQNSEMLKKTENIMKDIADDENASRGIDDEDEDEDEDESSKGTKKKLAVEQECSDWPLDADVGWGIRASEYFEEYSIKNVVGEDGVEIDWEGEIDDNWVKEINCLEWESFAFHPSPLVVLAFERYNRATDNWRVLKELEKAIKVYLNTKDRLPPRAVKIDINIEKDLAYALKVRDCPQILFLRGNRILYREKEIRTSDQLVHMIAHFYYNAKKPLWINDEALSPPF